MRCGAPRNLLHRDIGVIPQRGLAQLADFLLQSGDLLVTRFDFQLLHTVQYPERLSIIPGTSAKFGDPFFFRQRLIADPILTTLRTDARGDAGQFRGK